MSNVHTRESEWSSLSNSDSGSWMLPVSIVADNSEVMLDDCSLVGRPSTGAAVVHEHSVFDNFLHACNQRTDLMSDMFDDSASIYFAINKITSKIARDRAINFNPISKIGLLQIACGDQQISLFSYRADVNGCVEPLCHVPTMEVLQQSALFGTSGEPGILTRSVNIDGGVFIDNRLNDYSRTFLVFTVGLRD